MDKPKCKKGKAAVKASLLEQLEGKGADKSVFVEQVDSYMELYDVAKALQKDIKKRGINDIKNIFIASLDAEDELFIQLKGEKDKKEHDK